MTFLDPGDAVEAKRRLEDLAGQIPEVLSLDAVIDVVGSPVSAHLALVTTHEDLVALQGYQAHPVHEAFGGWVRPRLAGRVVVDAEV